MNKYTVMLAMLEEVLCYLERLAPTLEESEDMFERVANCIHDAKQPEEPTP